MKPQLSARRLNEYAIEYDRVRVQIQICGRSGSSRCSPDDLRRTCATWLRQDGAPPDLIAPVMGHADTRMVERVYGRLPLQDLEQRLAASLQTAADRYDRPRSDDTGTKPSCSVLQQTGRIRGVPPDSAPRSAYEKTRERRVLQCPGTESNRRHGIFKPAPRVAAAQENKRWARGGGGGCSGFASDCGAAAEIPEDWADWVNQEDWLTCPRVRGRCSSTTSASATPRPRSTAIERAYADGKVLTPDQGGSATTERFLPGGRRVSVGAWWTAVSVVSDSR